MFRSTARTATQQSVQSLQPQPLGANPPAIGVGSGHSLSDISILPAEVAAKGRSDDSDQTQLTAQLLRNATGVQQLSRSVDSVPAFSAPPPNRGDAFQTGGHRLSGFSILPSTKTPFQRTLDSSASISEGIASGGEPAIQRALPTKDEWVAASKIEGATFDVRSKTMKAIGAACDEYAATAGADPKTRMEALAKVLAAISAWNLSKGAGETAKDGTLRMPKPQDDTKSMGDNKRSAFVADLFLKVQNEALEILKPLQQRWSEESDQPGEGRSDPKQHDVNDFTYIINGVNGGVEGQTEAVHVTNMLKDPATIKNALMSVSLVTNTKTPMWCPSGFILKVPKENIMAASSTDVALQNSFSKHHDVEIYRELAAKFIEHQLPAPQAILDGMKGPSFPGEKMRKHNEVAVLGTNRVTKEEVKIIGIFIAVAPGTADARVPITLGIPAQDAKVNIAGPGEKADYRKVVKKQPGTSPERMAKYLEIASANGNLPLVAIPLNNSGFSDPTLDIWDERTMITAEDWAVHPQNKADR